MIRINRIKIWIIHSLEIIKQRAIKYHFKNRSFREYSPSLSASRNRRRNCNAWNYFSPCTGFRNYRAWPRAKHFSTRFVNSRISQSCFQLCSTREYRTDIFFLFFLKISLSLSLSFSFFSSTPFEQCQTKKEKKKKRSSIRKRKKILVPVFSPFFTPSKILFFRSLSYSR